MSGTATGSARTRPSTGREKRIRRRHQFHLFRQVPGNQRPLRSHRTDVPKHRPRVSPTRANKNEINGGLNLNQPDPRGVFRFQNYFVTATRRWNADGLVFDKYIGVGTNLDLRISGTSISTISTTPAGSTISIRAEARPSSDRKSDNINFGVGTDSRKRWNVFTNLSFGRDDEGGWYGFFGPSLRLQPSSRLQTSIGVSYNWGLDAAQWIENTDADGDGIEDNVYGRLRRNVVNITGRATYAFSRDMTLEAFLQPFVAVGGLLQHRKARASELVRVRAGHPRATILISTEVAPQHGCDALGVRARQHPLPRLEPVDLRRIAAGCLFAHARSSRPRSAPPARTCSQSRSITG